MSDPEFFYTPTRRTCGKCRWWGALLGTISGEPYVRTEPLYDKHTGIGESLCSRDMRTQTRGSDSCQRWEKERPSA